MVEPYLSASVDADAEDEEEEDDDGSGAACDHQHPHVQVLWGQEKQTVTAQFNSHRVGELG